MRFAGSLSALVTAVLFVAQAHAVDEVKYNLTLSSAAPILTYSEPQNVTADQGWNQSYTNSSWGNYHHLRVAEGNSTFTTRLPGASVTVNFVGTAVYFQGSGNGQVTLFVDQDEQRIALQGGEGYVEARELDYGNHTATLTLVEGEISLTHVILSTVVGGAGVAPVPAAIRSLDDKDFTNPELSLTGTWQENNQFCSQAPDDIVNCLRYDCLSTATTNAAIKMSIPANASTALLYGAVGTSHSPFSVTLNPAPPFGPAMQSYNASRTWLAPNIELYFASLDPTVQYTMTVMNLGPEGDQVLEWAKATFYVAQGGELWNPSANADANGDGSHGSEGNTDGSSTGAHGGAASKSSFPTGAVVGGAVGGAAALAAIGILVWWLLRRRRGARRSTAGEKYSLGGAGGRKRRKRLSQFEVDRLDDEHGQGWSGDYHILAPNGDGMVTPLPLPSSSEHHGAQSAPSATSPASPGMLDPRHKAWEGSTKHLDISPLSPASERAGTSSYSHFSGSSPVALHSPKVGYPPPTHPPRVVTEAEDAGRVEAPQPFVEEQVPPRYNPAWAEDEASRAQYANPRV